MWIGFIWLRKGTVVGSGERIINLLIPVKQELPLLLVNYLNSWFIHTHVIFLHF
jgi:hypothetical protein